MSKEGWGDRGFGGLAVDPSYDHPRELLSLPPLLQDGIGTRRPPGSCWNMASRSPSTTIASST
eukprot:5452739-Pleurochrysis_carterae.AAC.1